jgi:hypothetical protein
LILVDLPIEQRCAVACSMLPSVQVHLPLALNRGGLVLSKLSNRSILSLHDCLDQFLSHWWHLDVMFAATVNILSPETLFYLLVASTWEYNLRDMDRNIRHTAFKDVRKPAELLNDCLHDQREGLLFLKEQVAMSKKWMPLGVRVELQLA